MFLNEYDIDMLQREIDADETPNLRAGVDVIAELCDWVNANSDGWPYWRKPQAAAKRLSDLLYEAQMQLYRGNVDDIDRATLKKALTPIKSFLTRQGAKGALPALAAL